MKNIVNNESDNCCAFIGCKEKIGPYFDVGTVNVQIALGFCFKHFRNFIQPIITQLIFEDEKILREENS